MPAAKIKIGYRDKAKPDDVCQLGAFAQIAAKRKFGIEALNSGDPEPVLFGCYVELIGPAVVKKAGDAGFDEWLQTIAEFDVTTGGDAADPTPAETPSSEPSPGSPPTSD